MKLKRNVLRCVLSHAIHMLLKVSSCITPNTSMGFTHVSHYPSTEMGSSLGYVNATTSKGELPTADVTSISCISPTVIVIIMNSRL